MASVLDRVTGSDQSPFLERLAKPLISIATGTPQIELDRQETENTLLQQQIEGQRAAVESDAVTAQRDLRQQQLSARAFGDGPDADSALVELLSMNPEVGSKIREEIGIRDDSHLESIARRASEIQATAPDQRRPVILRQATEIEANGGDASQTLSLLEMTPEDQNQRLRIVQALPLSAKERQGSGLTSETRTSAARAAVGGFTSEEIRQQARIEAGITPRAGLSAQERIAIDPNLTTQVAGSQAAIAGAKTEAQIAAELRNAEEVGAAKAREAALVESALQGERIRANRIKTAEEARLLLPEAQAGANEMVVLLNDIRNDPELSNVLGAIEGRVDVRLDENESALLAKISQVTGKTFLQAYQSLKGGGPITDTEGRAATEAQSRLTNRTVSLESYQGAIDELIGITDARLNRLARKADLESTQQADTSGQAAPEGTVITNAQGQSFIKQNGQWVPNG